MQKKRGSRLTKSLKDAPKPPIVAGIIAVCALAIFGALQSAGPATVSVQKSQASEQTANEDASETKETQVSASSIQVDVAGAVANPGMYKLTCDDPRVNDAVEAAGGLLPEADTQTINLAQKIEDGTKVYIPKVGDVTGNASDTEVTSSTSSSTSSSTGQGSSTTSSANGLVNINTATSEQLQTLSGVGSATAEAIIKDREANGAFTSKEDLMRVSGIGEKKYAKIEAQICI